MLSSFFSSLDGWAWLALIGAFMVIPGVMLEGAEYIVKWSKNKTFRRCFRWSIGTPTLLEFLCIAKTVEKLLLPVESLGFLVLVFGLAVEIIGSFFSNRLQTRENFELSQSNINLTLRIEELRSNNLVLEKELQPRTITIDQITNFIFLTAKMPKFKVRVAAGVSSDEVSSFAWQIREMLNKAGFGVPDADTNRMLGIDWEPSAVNLAIPNTGTNWADLSFISDHPITPDQRIYAASFKDETTGRVQYAPIPNNIDSMYSVLFGAFADIGITNVTFGDKPDWVKPTHYEIFVIQKP
jgi:hypothetical protein